MRDGYAFLTAALLVAGSRVAGHPICFIDDRPPDLEQTLTFCPAPQDGACCTDAEEAEVLARFNAVGDLTNDCADLYKQVECGQCHSYSGHLFADLGSELGVEDGMTMKSEFCEELVDACDGQIDFPTYGNLDYCEKHTGNQEDDFFWSYPYVEEELFEPGINEAFPDLDPDDDFPAQTISMHQSPDGSMFWLGGQVGVIKKVDADNMDSISTVMDISSGFDLFLEYEEGLIDFAFGPLFSVDGYPNFFYVSYTVQLNDGMGQRNRLSRFEYFSGSASNTANSEEILLTTAPKSTNIHAAGWCGFKPSAYGDEEDSHDLYWTTGDGGPQMDTEGNGQNTLNLLAAVIRISVPSDGSGYTIPGGNYGSLPNVLPEICAIGFRNPWRCSFDRQNDDLWCGDVGHTYVEEIDIVECGKNYGWSRFEGSRCQEAMQDRDGPCDGATRSGFEFPVFEYCHPDYYDDVSDEDDFTNGVDICGDRSLTGHAVIGGHVYRGEYFADIIGGAYVFADNVNRNVYYIKKEGGKWTSGTIVSDKTVRVIGFSEDINGELMLISNDYKIYHMPCGDLCFQRAPSATAGFYLGCFADTYDARVLEWNSDSNSMTAKVCADLCGNSPYFGTQNGEECWCGDEDTDFTQHGDATCDYSCTGNNLELCGGRFAITAYAREDGDEGGIDPIEVDTRNPTPAPVPVGDVTYLGCFGDTKDDRVLAEQFVNSGLTPEICADICSGQAYFGLQYGVECWCGDASTDISQHGPAVCDRVCAGDSSTFCGGKWAISAYTFGDGSGPVTPSPVTPVTPEDTGYAYVGCFSDPKANPRLMPTRAAVDDSGMTAEECSELCSGSTFFGTQYGEECWCTDEASPDLDAFGDGNCNYPCTGDGGEICGGRYAISVYEYVEGGETCSNGIVGVENTSNGVCCSIGCNGKCGGSGCGNHGAGANACCTGRIIDSGVECTTSGAAPCII